MPLTPEQLERVRYLVEDDWAAASADESAQWADFDRTLAQVSAEELHAFVDRMNFGGGAADRLTRVLAHPLCDRGTALMAYWRTRPLFYLPYETRDRVAAELGPTALADFDLLRAIEHRFAHDTFLSAALPFDPTNDHGRDLTAKHPRRKPVPIYRQENGRRIQTNKDAPLGDPIDPRTVLPAAMFEPIPARSSR